MPTIPVPPKPMGLSPYVVEFLIDGQPQPNNCGNYRDKLLASDAEDAKQRLLATTGGISRWHQKHTKGEGKITVVDAYRTVISNE